MEKEPTKKRAKNEYYKHICLNDKCKKEFVSRSERTQWCSDNCRTKYYDLDNPEVREEILKNAFDDNGKLKKGNKLCLLNKTYKSQAEWRSQMHKLFRECLTAEEFAQIVKKIVDQSKKGNNQAQKELLERILGKEKENIDLSVNKIVWKNSFDEDTIKDKDQEENID